MRADLVNPFVVGLQEVMTTMCATQAIIHPHVIKESDGETFDISATVDFGGDVTGCMVLCCSLETAVKLATGFASNGGEHDGEVDVDDALGEVANIIAGGAKSRFRDQNMSISVPTVVRGSHQILGASKSTPHRVIPCSTEYGEFFVEVDLR